MKIAYNAYWFGVLSLLIIVYFWFSSLYFFFDATIFWWIKDVYIVIRTFIRQSAEQKNKQRQRQADNILHKTTKIYVKLHKTTH